VSNVARVFGMAALTFLVALFFTPTLLKVLRHYHFGKSIRNSGNTPVYSELHVKKEGTPVGGGIIIWGTVFGLALIFALASILIHSNITEDLNFLSRQQTTLPLAALLFSALVGLVDDYLNVRKVGPYGGGLRMVQRLVLYAIVAAIGAWWFYYKLNWSVIHVPGVGDFEIGWWYIPLFIFVIVSTAFSVNEADGLDGLAGGILLFCFGAYTAIAFALGRIELSIFCAAIAGALLAFLWFNVYPARFFMGDTGAMSLGTTLGVIAMLTNSVLVLPIIAFPLVLESASVIIQITSKKLRGKKVFLSAPLHHHFEALGWPETQVTMRFWILAAVSAIIGLVIGLIGMGQFSN
jgi:phospho-N-acetylmuramoyl-pentapeptide-transferase